MNFTAAHLRWTRLLWSNVRCTKPVGGISQGAQEHSVIHLKDNNWFDRIRG